MLYGTPPLLPESASSNPAHHVHLNLDSGAARAQLGHIFTTGSGMSPAVSGQDWTGSVSDSTTGVNTVHANGIDLTPPAGKTAGTYNDKGYNLVVTHSSAVATNYSVTYHCEDTQASGYLHTGTGANWTNSQTPNADNTIVIDNP